MQLQHQFNHFVNLESPLSTVDSFLYNNRSPGLSCPWAIHQVYELHRCLPLQHNKLVGDTQAVHLC